MKPRPVSAWPLVLLLVLAVGCSEEDTLTCEWLQGDNCWKSTGALAMSCLPPMNESGVLAADNRTCTYATGSVVTFDKALVLPLPDGQEEDYFKFTVATGGQTCLRYQSQGSGFDLTVQGQTFKERATGGLGISVTCPDGKSYKNSNAFDLLSCEGGIFGGLPGNTWSSSSLGLSFGLIGTTESIQVFDCRTPT
jgi:hypothetical protein